MKLPISNIIINERQRLDLGDLSDLDSMGDPKVGQILPIVCDRQNNLLDGRRRLAKAVSLNWTEIEVHIRTLDDDPYIKQLVELYADIGRKERTWQERAITFLKLHEMNPALTRKQLATIMGISLGNVSETLSIARELRVASAQLTLNDKELWATTSVFDAAKTLIIRQARFLEVEMNKRAGVLRESVLTPERITQAASVGGTLPKPVELLERTLTLASAEASTSFTTFFTSPYTTELRKRVDGKPYDAQLLFLHTPLYQRISSYNIRNDSTKPLVMSDDNQFIYGFWFVGGGNISEFYGSYARQYWASINALFEDCQKPMHLFAGSLPPSDKYVRVGLDPTGKYKYEIECDAEQLDSSIAVQAYAPDVIFADPPYSVEDMEHYKNDNLVNRPKVLSACSRVLQPGGYVVWLDQVLPVFSNVELKWVGCISYIRSTGNRFRCVCIFQKPLISVTEPNENK